MELDLENFQKWKHALSIAENIGDDAKLGRLSKTDLRNYLLTVEEAMGPSPDPADDFQGFVLLELCRAIRRSLETS